MSLLVPVDESTVDEQPPNNRELATMDETKRANLRCFKIPFTCEHLFTYQIVCACSRVRLWRIMKNEANSQDLSAASLKPRIIAVAADLLSQSKPIKLPTMREIAINLSVNELSKTYDSFWTSRPSLQAIYKLARHKVVSPFSLLGVAMQRALHTVPYSVHYESFRGLCPLNTLMAFVGPTGTGKTLSLNVVNNGIVFSDSSLALGGDGTWTGVIEPGSGEAMPDSYKMLTKDDETKKTKVTWVHSNHAAIFGFDEVGMLEGRNAREGSTLLETMKQGWSGSTLGRKLANGKGTLLDAESYRCGLFINVQPARISVGTARSNVRAFSGKVEFS